MRNEKGKKKTNHVHLPREIIYAILLRVPAQFLIIFKIVCKLWNETISDPDFVKDHLAHNKSNNQHAIVRMYQLGKKKCVPTNLQDSTAPPFQSGMNDVYIHDSCNGILLVQCVLRSPPPGRLFTQRGPFYAFNPVTGQCTMWSPPTGFRGQCIIWSPPTGFHPQYWSLVYDLSKDKCKVLCVNFNNWMICTVSSIDDIASPRILDLPHKKVEPLESRVFTNNEIHWLVNVPPVQSFEDFYSGDVYIYSMDVTSEEIREMKLMPIRFKTFGEIHLLDFHGNLSIAHAAAHNQLDIWTLVDKISSEWNRSHSICLDFPLLRDTYIYSVPSSNSSEKKILGKHWDNVFLYDLKSGKVERSKLGVLAITYDCLHVNSLLEWK